MASAGTPDAKLALSSGENEQDKKQISATEHNDSPPSEKEQQFARACYIMLALWPAMRQAVLEQWGGIDSEEKRTYLLSYLCDEYGSGKGSCPDADDLADLLENYMAEEYDCQLEDDSSMLVAAHVVECYKAIFEQENGSEFVNALEKSFAKAYKTVQTNATHHSGEELDDNNLSDEETQSAVQNDHTSNHSINKPKPEPEIDEDGFETVVSRRRR
ncbi:rRNA accumulation- protein [Malassezia yamatoensis]|uniref:rRNA accumulation- protein n=1 Tax=Malassezia yamatoensis TaxID=253288 RepID=A0AAJ6CEY6_9BASI|nr:rRNA accumulation- protein [Malassezia yamatoensis]